MSPYDFIADYFRGATGMMKDLFRHKDRLLAMLDKAATFLTRQTVATAQAAGHPIVMIPIHWAPSPPIWVVPTTSPTCRGSMIRTMA